MLYKGHFMESSLISDEYKEHTSLRLSNLGTGYHFFNVSLAVYAWPCFLIYASSGAGHLVLLSPSLL